MTPSTRLLAAVLALLAAAAIVPTGARGNTPARLSEALALLSRGDVANAGSTVARAGDPVATDLVIWTRLAEGNGTWGEMARHLERHPGWPRNAAIRRHAERQMPPGLDPRWVVSFFANGALTGPGALRHAAALRALGQEAAAVAVLEQAWTTMPLREVDRLDFQRAEPALTRRLAAARLDAMLWEGNVAQAEALLPLVDENQRRLGLARVTLQDRRNGVDARVAAVPRGLADNPGLAHDRFEWRMRSGREDAALELIEARSGSAASLGRPEAWGRRRLALTRRLMREGDFRRAYSLASRHHLSSGADFAELEWLSGWLALRRLNDPARALRHFETVWNGVSTPISLGRAGYWAGRAAEAQGDRRAAERWFAMAAEHSTAFYGQLAADRIGRDIGPELAASGPAGNRSLLDPTMVHAVQLLSAAGQEAAANAFLLALAGQQSTPEGFAAAGHLALGLQRPEAAVRIGKMAAARGHIIMDIAFPVIRLSPRPSPVELALALSIARQESEFNPRAVSPAGALGLMQLMPATATRVARDLGLRHTTAMLTSDPNHNVTLGKTYLASRLERFNGAVILAAASYNAGASRVDEWIGRFGDPRNPAVDPVDWIESIPFAETRNYVQRVMEGLHIYRARLGESPREMRAALVTPQTGRRQGAAMPGATSPAPRPRG